MIRDLGSNELSGQIPSQLGNLKQLSDLYLDSNELSGSIPSQLGNLKQLLYLDLSNNPKLDRVVPDEVVRLVVEIQSLAQDFALPFALPFALLNENACTLNFELALVFTPCTEVYMAYAVVIVLLLLSLVIFCFRIVSPRYNTQEMKLFDKCSCDRCLCPFDTDARLVRRGFQNPLWRKCNFCGWIIDQEGRKSCGLETCCCPCIIEGETASLLKSKGANDDCLNNTCLLTCLCGTCVGTTLNRQRARKEFGYSKSLVTECILALPCFCLYPCLSRQTNTECREKYKIDLLGADATTAQTVDAYQSGFFNKANVFFLGIEVFSSIWTWMALWRFGTTTNDTDINKFIFGTEYYENDIDLNAFIVVSPALAIIALHLLFILFAVIGFFFGSYRCSRTCMIISQIADAVVDFGAIILWIFFVVIESEIPLWHDYIFLCLVVISFTGSMRDIFLTEESSRQRIRRHQAWLFKKISIVSKHIRARCINFKSNTKTSESVEKETEKETRTVIQEENESTSIFIN